MAENPNAISLNPNDLVISAIISNGGASAGLIKNNTGSLQLTGNNTYTGPTTVNAGVLLVDGSQTGSTVTVNSGAALGGNGTTGAVLANGGGVNPGDPINSLGTLSEASADFSGNGSLTIQAAGTSPAGISTDLLNVSGALKLGGTSTLILDVAQLATTGTALGVIHFGSITGTFTNVALINNPNNYQASLVYNANSIDVTFSVAATSHLAFSVQPATTTAGVAISPAVTVRVLDSSNNLVTSDNTDQVTLTVASGPGGFTGGSTTTVTVIGGIATFNNLVLNTAGTYTLGEAGTGGLAGPASGSFNVNPAAAHHLAVGIQPGNTVAGVVISPAVTVRVLDQFNNLVTTDTSNVTLAIGTNPGGGTLSGTTTVAAVGGIATFNNLSINKAGTGYTLTAADGSLTGTTSGSFNISPAAADHLAVGIQPGNTVAGVVISPAVTVRVLDQFDNLVTTDTSNVTVAIGTNPGGGTLSGTTTVAAVGGVVTFNNLSINKAGTGYTLDRRRRQPHRRHLRRFRHLGSRRRPPGRRHPAGQHRGRGAHQSGGDGARPGPVQQSGDHRHVERDGGHRYQPGQRHAQRHDHRGGGRRYRELQQSFHRQGRHRLHLDRRRRQPHRHHLRQFRHLGGRGESPGLPAPAEHRDGGGSDQPGGEGAGARPFNNLVTTDTSNVTVAIGTNPVRGNAQRHDDGGGGGRHRHLHHPVDQQDRHRLHPGRQRRQPRRFDLHRFQHHTGRLGPSGFPEPAEHRSGGSGDQPGGDGAGT